MFPDISFKQRGSGGDSGSSGNGNILAYAGNPNGNVSATGPAICIDNTTVPPTIWQKFSAGTSNNEWN